MNYVSDLFPNAEVRMTLQVPFISQVYFSIPNTIDDSIPTACTNGRKRKFNQSFMDSLPLDEQCFLLSHETLHDVLEHGFRCGSRDSRVWNLACDFKVNQFCKEAGLKVPSIGLLDTKYDELSEEQVYSELLKDPKLEKMLAAFEPDIIDISDLPEDQKKEILDKIRTSVIQAAQVTKKQAGKVPQWMEKWIEQLVCPTPKWHEELRRFFRSFNYSEYSWTKVNRRESRKMGYLCPANINETLGTLAIGIDQSGSMGEEQMSEIAFHLNSAILECMPEKVVVYCFDTDCAEPEEYSSYDYPITLRRVKTGGTCFIDVCKKFEEIGADLGLIFTDGQGTFPDDCKVNTVWCNIAREDFTPPFGEYLSLGM